MTTDTNVYTSAFSHRMTHFNTTHTKKTGFTLVELVIVIAVIAILASIVLVAYPGYQARNRDTDRKSDIQQVATALTAYALQKNDYVETASGCGANGNGNGWLGVGPADLAFYPRSISDCLRDAKVLPTGDFIDPTNCIRDSSATCGVYGGTPTKAYMKATCVSGGVEVTYVFAYLETQPQKQAEVDALCDTNTVNGFTSTSQKWGTYYGMNYYVRVK